MNFSSSLKKIICFILAVLMLFSTVGCQQTTKKKKKKVIVKKQVIVKENEDNNDNNQSNVQVVVPDDTPTTTEPEKDNGLPDRPLPEVSEDTAYVEWIEPVVPEFDYEYASLNITKDYVIVYALESWQNRKESRNEDGTDRYITSTGFARIAAYDLQAYFKDKLNLKLDVKLDTKVAADAKKILVGDTAYYKSNLGETEFGVKVKGDDLIFEGGHFAMVNKAVKWYETVDVKDGKVATLNGTCGDFKSQVTLNGITYDYVWGDEFDGHEFNNAESWSQSSFGEERSDDLVNIYNDERFQFIENGRLRLTADRYYDEGNGAIGYATSGDLNTDGIMQFRNGYFEFRARLPYRRGAFPAIWTMSGANNKKLPNYNYDDGFGQISKCFWSIEFDLFESMADADHMTTTIHKWYSDNGIGRTTVPDVPVVLTSEQVKELNDRAVKYHYASKAYDAQGNEVLIDASMLSSDASGNVGGKEYIYYPIYLNFDDNTQIDIFEYRKRPFTNMSASGNTYAYSHTYPSTGSDRITGSVKDGKYDWSWYFDPETINKEYHIYAFHYTSDHCTVFMDGQAFLDFDWDPVFDLYDVNGDGVIKDITANAAGVSNNGVGFNLWHYFLIDMLIFTPNSFNIDQELKLVKGDYPFNLYIDWVRCYQDLDDPSQALWFPNGAGDNAQ